MARQYSIVDTSTDTFQTLIDRTNDLVNVVNTAVITTNTGGGDITSGNAFVNGYFGANSLVTTIVKAGNVTVAGALLTIDSNTLINSSSLSVGNSTINSVITGTRLLISNSTTTSIANADGIFISNTTSNAVVQGDLIKVANSTSSANLNASSLTIGTSVVNSSTIAVGSNVIVNTSALFLGNSTVNTNYVSTLLQLANSTSIANLNPASLTIGGTVVNSSQVTVTLLLGNVSATFANVSGQVNTATLFAATSANVGANIQITTQQFAITGNSTTQPSLNLTSNSTVSGLRIGNSSVTGAPSIVLANSIGNTVFNTTSTVISNSSGVVTTANLSGIYTAGVVNAATLSTASFSANSTLVNTAAINVTGAVNTATLFVSTSANIASAVTANSTGIWISGIVNAATLSVGTSVVANTTRLAIGTSVGLLANGSIGTAGQRLTSNGTTVYWETPGAVVAGSDTQVQFNDGGTLSGDSGFTFNKTTDTITVVGSVLSGATVNAVTLSTASFSANSTLVNAAAINVVNQINAATLYTSGSANVTGALNAIGGLNVPATNYITVGNSTVNVQINSTAVSANTLSVYNLVVSGNISGTFSATGNILPDANNTYYIGTSTNTFLSAHITTVNANTFTTYNSALTANGTGLWTSGTVNGATLSVGSAFIANTTGLYHTSLVNSASFNVGSLTIANATGVYTTTINAASHSVGTATIANSTGVFTTGTVNGSIVSVGSAVISNSTGVWTTGVVNAATLSVGTSVVANTTRLAIGTSVGVQANGGIGTSGQVLTSNGTTVYWSTPSPGVTGSDTQVQFNDGGSLGSDAGLVYNKTTDALTVANVVSTNTINSNTLSTSNVSMTHALLRTTSNTTTGTSEQAVDTFAVATYRGAEYVVSIKDNNANAYQISKMLVVHNDGTSYITEYGTMSTNTNLGTFATDINTGNVRLLFTPTSSNTTVKLVRTTIAV